MRLRKLGKRGPDISVVGYGAWEIGGESYGPNPSKDDVVRAVHAALDAGMNWIDTAEIYGGGRSEELAGEAIRGRDALVATKVAPRPVGTGFSPKQVRRALETSLRRLRTDHVDLYQLHWLPEDTEGLEETWGTMAALQDEGLVRHVGVSNFGIPEIERCMAIRHVDSLQPQLSMLHRHGETLSPWCEEHGVGVIVYGPLAYGLLTGAVTSDTKFARDDWRSGSDPEHSYYRDLFAPGRIERNLEIVERLKPIASRAGATMGQLALAWTFHRPGITAAIAGSRSPEHNRENAGAGDVELSEEVLAEIEDVLR